MNPGPGTGCKGLKLLEIHVELAISAISYISSSRLQDPYRIMAKSRRRVVSNRCLGGQMYLYLSFVNTLSPSYAKVGLPNDAVY
jgi:hypothetical protein